MNVELYPSAGDHSIEALEDFAFECDARMAILSMAYWIGRGDSRMNFAHYIIIASAGIGLYIAAYFTLVYYGLLAPSTRLMPSLCRLEERTCQTVLGTKYARLFGVPNSLLGVLYYASVIVISSGGWTASPTGSALIVVAWFTVAVGLVLVYSLFFIIKIPCPLCLAGHAINLLLALLLTAGTR